MPNETKPETTEVTEPIEITKTLKLIVYPTNKDQRDLIRASLRQYRFICSQAIAMKYIAEVATATAEKKGIIPDTKKAEEALKYMFDKEKGSAIETHIKALAPTWRSDLVQECRRNIDTAMSARDPKIKSNRRYLVLNGARNIPEMKSVGLPIKYCAGIGAFRWLSKDDSKPDGKLSRKFEICWDNEIGYVQFAIAGKRTKTGWGLEPWQVGLLHAIQNGTYQMCTSRLNERYGDFYYEIPYKFTPKPKTLDTKRTIHVALDPEKLAFRITLEHGLQKNADDRLSYTLEVAGATPKLAEYKHQKEKLKNALSACGNKNARRHAEGSQKGWEVYNRRLDHLTQQRSNFVKHWNHVWAARIIRTAVEWSAGTVAVLNLPDTLFGEPWQWADFKFKMTYKAKEQGIKVSFTDAPTAEDVADAIQSGPNPANTPANTGTHPIAGAAN